MILAYNVLSNPDLRSVKIPSLFQVVYHYQSSYFFHVVIEYFFFYLWVRRY